MFLTEHLQYFYVKLVGDIKENNYVIREQENFWTDLTYLYQSPIYIERLKRRDMLAEAMARVNEQLEALKKEETEMSN